MKGSFIVKLKYETRLIIKMLKASQDAPVKSNKRLEAETVSKVKEVGMVGTDVEVVLSMIESLQVRCTVFEATGVDGTVRDMEMAKFKRVYHCIYLLVHPGKVVEGKMRELATECTKVLTNAFVVAQNWALLHAGKDEKKALSVQVKREMLMEVPKPPGEYQAWFTWAGDFEPNRY